MKSHIPLTAILLASCAAPQERLTRDTYTYYYDGIDRKKAKELVLVGKGEKPRWEISARNINAYIETAERMCTLSPAYSTRAYGCFAAAQLHMRRSQIAQNLTNGYDTLQSYDGKFSLCEEQQIEDREFLTKQLTKNIGHMKFVYSYSLEAFRQTPDAPEEWFDEVLGLAASARYSVEQEIPHILKNFKALESYCDVEKE
jgi:hypothetical protein